MNLYDELFAADADRVFLHDGDTTYTYGDLDLRSRRMGAALRARGLQPGDRLVGQTAKSVDTFALWLGCLAAGIVYVPTNTAYTTTELDFFCANADASLFVADELNATNTATPQATLAELATAADDSDPLASPHASDPLDPAALVYTSGTTGRPKGATLTHSCLLDNGRALAEVWQYRPDDLLLHSLPIFHVHGLLIALSPTMLSGAQVRWLPRFDVDAVIEHLPEATVFMGVPTYYHRLLNDDRFGPDLCTNMRLFTSGSAPMTEQVHAAFTDRTNRKIVERYGMSEAGIIASNRIGTEVAGSVGHALPGYELRITDDDRSPVEAGVTGTVEVRGPSLCAGYWQRPDADAESRTADGWFSTGDVGSVDATGRLTLEGRSSDMIISGGLNIYPKEIEIVLDALDGVVESAVIGRPDEDFGESVHAYLVLADGIQMEDLPLETALAELARFKHPRSFIAIDELPRNAMGKVQKTVLRTGTV